MITLEIQKAVDFYQPLRVKMKPLMVDQPLEQ